MFVHKHLGVFFADFIVADRDERTRISLSEGFRISTLSEDSLAGNTIIEECYLTEDSYLLKYFLNLTTVATGAEDEDIHF